MENVNAIYGIPVDPSSLGSPTNGYPLTYNSTKKAWDLQSCPVISIGTAAPATTPSKVGNVFIDTTNKKIYFATGVGSSADWTIVN
jgi:hypothetical protein